MAGMMTGGDDNDEAGDDEDGIQFITPMIPGEPAAIRVTAVNNTQEEATLYVFADFNGDGILEPLTFDNGDPM